MPALRTEITEIVTGLGMSGHDDLDTLLDAGPPAALEHVDDRTWARLVVARRERDHDHDFLAAWNNGRAFLFAREGLRGRAPISIEWKGGHRDPGDTVVPADLRVDHVYLVSCKYLSKVLHNASPAALFDRHLQGAQGTRSERDWFDEVAPAQHQELYQVVRRTYGADLELPEAVSSLSKPQRRELRTRVPRAWSQECAAAYDRLTEVAAAASARRWDDSLQGPRARSSMLWRLLRLAPAPHFVLGTSRAGSLRLRVGTPWDFARHHRLRELRLWGRPAGQATVRWSAHTERLDGSGEATVEGHVELRWSHGRFGGPPEAKVYLDTPHTRVPGYDPLA